jgi:crotonobetainyl-CoA:carnitine CoA-transferase CaiB-like acyl-CoA transferase
LHQAAYLVCHDRKQWNEPAGVNARGWTALQRMYRASDGWFFLGARLSDKDALLKIEGLKDIDIEWESAADPGGPLAQHFEHHFASAQRGECVARLITAGIGAQAILAQEEIINQRPFIERKLVQFERRSDGSEVPQPGIGPWLSATPPRAGKSPEIFGSDVGSILHEIGFGDRTKELAAIGVIVVP